MRELDNHRWFLESLMKKNASWPQLLIALALIYWFGLLFNTCLVRLGWILLSWGEVVTAEPTWPACIALGAVLFFLRAMFNSVDEKK